MYHKSVSYLYQQGYIPKNIEYNNLKMNYLSTKMLPSINEKVKWKHDEMKSINEKWNDNHRNEELFNYITLYFVHKKDSFVDDGIS